MDLLLLSFLMSTHATGGTFEAHHVVQSEPKL